MLVYATMRVNAIESQKSSKKPIHIGTTDTRKEAFSKEFDNHDF